MLCEFEKKKHAKVTSISLKNKTQIFITQFTLQTLFSKIDYQEQCPKTKTILRVCQSSHRHKFAQSQSVFWLQSHSMKRRLSVTNLSLKDNFDDVSTECSSLHALMMTGAFSRKHWQVIFQLVTDNFLFIYTATN